MISTSNFFCLYLFAASIICVTTNKIDLINFNVYKDGNQTWGQLKVPDFLIDSEFQLIKDDSNHHQYLITSKKPWEFNSTGNISINQQKPGQFNVLSQMECSLVKLLINSNLTILPNGYDLSAEVELNVEQQFDAVYNLNLRTSADCPKLYLKHNLTTRPEGLLNFSSHFHEHCPVKECDQDNSVIDIDINLRSAIHNWLTTELKQLFVFNVNNGYESMNATNSNWDMNVEANWESFPKIKHEKIFSFNSKFVGLPSFRLQYLNDGNTKRIIYSKKVSQLSVKQDPHNQCFP